MTDENAKKAILARRARFIAAATLSAGLVSCNDKRDTAPTVCLSVALPPSTDTAPQPCLSPVRPTPPDGTGTSATEGGPPDAGPAPQPCLAHRPPKTPPKPPPKPCLSQAPPRPCLDY